jgi:hypothetical protein
MYKGYKNFIKFKNQNIKNIYSLPQIVKCRKCSNINSVTISPAIRNICNCSYCGNPYYIIN